MSVSRRTVVVGTVSTAALASTVAGTGSAASAETSAGAVKAAASARDRKLLTRMLRVMYPHARFPDGPYERTADAVAAAANKTPGQALTLHKGLGELRAVKFEGLDDAAATAHLEAIEGSPFFGQVRGTAVVALYDDHEVWKLLGYEGSSFDKGGYIERGFNDLDWLPEPRIAEIRK